MYLLFLRLHLKTLDLTYFYSRVISRYHPKYTYFFKKQLGKLYKRREKIGYKIDYLQEQIDDFKEKMNELNLIIDQIECEDLDFQMSKRFE